MDNNQKLYLPELLAPAGSLEKLKAAVHYGADAVYLGGKAFSLRARASNFENDSIKDAVAYAHQFGVKVYVTVNIFAHNRDLEGLEEYFSALAKSRVDGIIVADPGILRIARQQIPEMDIHLSTQANVTNSSSARFWAEQGVSRLNLARELGLQEIQELRQVNEMELEVFVHGALCISYSGRCMLSNYFTGRDANKGDCAHPCRYSYKLVEEKRPDQYFPIEEDDRGTYIFNSQDLCLLHRLPQLITAGVDSIKIEGRMKSMGYVGSVVRLYRAALDWIEKEFFSGIPLEKISLPPVFDKELRKIGTRGQTENFFSSTPSSDAMLYDTMRVAQDFAPAGIVRDTEPLLVEARNVVEVGNELEYLSRAIEPVPCVVIGMEDINGIEKSRANPGNMVILKTDPELVSVDVHSILRKKIE